MPRHFGAKMYFFSERRDSLKCDADICEGRGGLRRSSKGTEFYSNEIYIVFLEYKTLHEEERETRKRVLVLQIAEHVT
jgi:hypothetical protein